MNEWQPGTILANKYKIVKELGRGGFGVTYLVEHLHLDGERRVLKRLHAAHSNKPDFIRSFRKEANKLLKLRNCKNVVNVLDLEEIDGAQVLVMEFIDGAPLAELPSPCDIGEGLRLAKGIAEGLQAMHAVGVVHLDIKLDNILIERPTAQPRIIDLGIAIDLDGSSFSVQGASAGYAPPEQYSANMTGGGAGRSLDGRTDLYATGVVLYLMLTGRFPFAGVDANQWMQFQCLPEAPSKHRQELADWGGLDELVVRLLQTDRDKRVADAATAIRMIDAIDSRHALVLGHNREFAAILPEAREAFAKGNFFARVIDLVDAAEKRVSRLDAASMLAEAREAFQLRQEAQIKLAAARAMQQRITTIAAKLYEAIGKKSWAEAEQIAKEATSEDAETPPLKEAFRALEMTLWNAATEEVRAVPAQFQLGYGNLAWFTMTRLNFKVPVTALFWNKLEEVRKACNAGHFGEARQLAKAVPAGPGFVLADLEEAISTWDIWVKMLASTRKENDAWHNKVHLALAIGLVLLFGVGLWIGHSAFPSPGATASAQAEIESYVAERETWHANKGSDEELKKALDLVKRWRVQFPQSQKLKELEETVQKRINNP